MSDRPTPETDAFIASQNHSPTTHQLRNFARIFERERDEAREKYDNEAVEHMLAINKICNERDGAIEKHRFAVIHWQIGSAKMERERDEAREKFENEMKWHHRTHQELVEAQCKLLDIEYDKLKS